MISRDYYHFSNSLGIRKHSTRYSECFWCNKYCKYKGILVKRGWDEYELPYCSRRCYHEDPNSVKITDQFISDCKEWSIREKEKLNKEKAARVKQIELDRVKEVEDFKNQQHKNMIFGCIGMILFVLDFYFLFKKKLFVAIPLTLCLLVVSSMINNKKQE